MVNSISVKVSTVQIFDGNNEVTGNTLTVVNKEEKLLKCIPGNGNPTPTVEWFIGQTLVSGASQFSFIPDNSYHGHQIYCVADNIPNNGHDVVSNKLELYVKGNYGCLLVYKYDIFAIIIIYLCCDIILWVLCAP